MKHYLLSKTLVLTTVLMLGLASVALANVSVTTTASGGTNISADNAANSTSGGAWTTLTSSIVIAEGNANDIAAGSGKTFLINAPAGWKFNTNSLSISATGNGITGLSAVTDPSGNFITVTYTASGTGGTASTSSINKFTIGGIQVKASVGSPIPQLGNITITAGTGAITGLPLSNAGQLSLQGGAATTLNMSTIPTPQSPNNNFSITITGTDQFGNNATGSLTLSANAGTVTPTTATLANGTVTTNVSVNTAGTGRTIKATAVGGAFVTSNAFDVLTTTASDYFRSQASTSWSTASTWQSSHDSSAWFTATAVPTATAKRVTILNDVTISTTSISASNIIINAGGSLTISSGRTLTLSAGSDTALHVLGTLTNSGTITINSGALIAFDNGGSYEHAENGGTIPTATWNHGSTCVITASAVGFGNTNTAPSGLGQSFDSFTWSSNLDRNAVSLGGSLTTINGTFTFSGSGSNELELNSSTAVTPTISIGGDFVMQSGTLDFDDGNAGIVTLNIAGDVNITGGTLDPNNGSTTAHILKVGGNWANSGSSTAFTAGSSTVIFNGSAAQTISGSRSTAFNKLTISNTNGNVTLATATSVTNALAFTSGKLDASAFTLTYGPTATTSASAITGVGANSYIITGNGFGSGKLIVNRIASGSAYTLPVGTAADYLPAAINPVTNNLNWSASVFNPATTDATYGSGHNFSGISLADIVNAVWVVAPSGSSTTTTAALTLNWTSDLEGSAFSGYSSANIGISHYNGSVWQNSTATGGANNSTNTVTSQFTSFSPFGVGSIGNALPITIINFKAVLNSNNTVSLTWQTTVEENSDHFDVERSADGSHWSSIGTVEAQGNSEIVVNYSYLDASPASGVNYYRLNMIDKNGSHSYTEVKVVNMNAIAAFRIFPNPAKDFVNVTLGRVSGNSTIRLFNFSGQTVFTQHLNNESGNTVSIPVQNLAQGTYMLQVSGSDGSQHTGQVIIVR